jgi:hypothetical protein
MIDEKFCQLLELRISDFLRKADNESFRGFWCDGVLLPSFESEYSKKFVNDNRKLTLKAFIGYSGQDEYELTLLFGIKSLSKYSRDLELSETIPSDDTQDWMKIDVDKRRIQINLL